MNKEDLKRRTKDYALRIIKLVSSLPKTREGRIIGDQLLKSGTSTAANYRAACRSRSKAEFIAKLGTVIEESDESLFWLEIIVESGMIKKELVEQLLKETDEIISIMVSTRKSSIKNK